MDNSNNQNYNESNSWVCPTCGIDNMNQDNYCKNCGTLKQTPSSESGEQSNLQDRSQNQQEAAVSDLEYDFNQEAGQQDKLTFQDNQEAQNNEPTASSMPSEDKNQIQSGQNEQTDQADQADQFSQDYQTAQPSQVNPNEQSSNQNFDFGGGFQQAGESINLDQQPPKKRKKTVKIILNLLLILIILGALGTGGYLLYKDYYQKRNIAKDYYQDESARFFNVVKKINDLSTESVIEQKPYQENSEVYQQNLEDEKHKTELALDELKKARENKEDPSINSVSDFSSVLDDFYSHAQNNLNKYNDYYAYELKITREGISSDDEYKKLENDFRTINNYEDLTKRTNAVKENFEKYESSLKEIEAPEELKEYHKKLIEHYEKFNSIYGQFAKAIEDKDDEEIQRLSVQMDEFMEEEKETEEAQELFDYFCENLYENFDELRKKADDIKNELVYKSGSLKFDLEKTYIKGW